LSKYNDIDKIIKHIRQIETTCDEATIKQIVCILVSRLLNPMAVEETAGLMVGLAEAEQAALDELEKEIKKDSILH
jgi:hypothetical protein